MSAFGDAARQMQTRRRTARGVGVIRAWIRAWLGIDAIETRHAALVADVSSRHLAVRAELHRETTALAASLLTPPTATAVPAVVLRDDEPRAFTIDPHLGRY